MQFNVLLQLLVNVKVEGVEADSQTGAIEAADKLIDPSRLAQVIGAEHNCPAGATWAELAEDQTAYALVDEVGDEQYERSVWHFNDPATGWRPIDPIDNSTPGQPGETPAPAALNAKLLQAARCALADLEGLAQRLCIDLDDPDEEPAAQTVRELREIIDEADLTPIRPPYECDETE